MRLKTFRGTTMAETLGQVKRQFGPNAVILNTRTVAKGGLLGMPSRALVEITAARAMADLPDELRRGRPKRESGQYDRAEGACALVPPISEDRNSPSSAVLLSEVGALKSLVHDLVQETRHCRVGNVPDELFETYGKLIENAVAEQIAQQLIDKVRHELGRDKLGDPDAVRGCLAQAIESMLPTAGPIRFARTGAPTIIALVGPTGVGKTTTIAKLAANYALRMNRKVGLITIDTYRIAAVDQLRTYAEIIDVPLEVVTSPGELQDAVARMADRDLIFIDTAGRSQRDMQKIEDLTSFFGVVRPDEVHLVLSGTCSERVLAETIRGFEGVGIDRLLFTKLDEAIGFGVILDCIQKTKASLSYVTTGQDVPDDIHVGKGKTLARLILGERNTQAVLGTAQVQGG